MARTNATNFTGGLQFPYATAATDIFKKEDVQVLAQAVDQHDHTAGKGISVAPANASVTNAKLASDTARANLLTNGGFEIWQRGTGPISASNVLTADRWRQDLGAGASIGTVRDAPNTDSTVPGGYCAGLPYTHAGAVTYFYQTIEDYGQLRGRTVSFSIRVKTAQASAVSTFRQFGGANTTGSTHSGSGLYETLSFTAQIPTNQAAPPLVGVALQASCTAYLDNAMLVVGSQPADYAPLHPADDLARCLRYYEIFGSTTGEIQWAGYMAAAAQVQWYLPWRVTKPVTPTVTKNGTWSVANASQPVIGAGLGLGGVSILLTATALGQAATNNSGAGQNITVESNP